MSSVVAAIPSAEIKQARPDYPVHDLVRRRWSPRAFDARPVDAEKIRSVLEAARWAASARNGQPWSFIVATQEQPADFQRMVDCLAAGNVAWASQAPVLILSVAQQISQQENRPITTALYDLGLAVQNLTVQATALDLYVHQMGGFDKQKAAAEFHIPEEYAPVTMLALGYLGDPGILAEDRRASELQPRTRKPLPEFVFGSRWGEVASLLTD